MEASSTYNKRMLSERKMRIPFIDSQTKVAQSNNCMLWLMEYQRRESTTPSELTGVTNGATNGRVYSYPVKKWYKHRRLDSSHLLRHYHPHHHQYYMLHHQQNHAHHHHPNPNHHNHHNHHHHHHHHHTTLSAGQETVNHAHLVNENSNSMDSMGVERNATTGVLAASMTPQPASNGPSASVRDESSSATGENGTEQQQTRHHAPPTTGNSQTYIDDSFENFDSFNEPEADSDHDEYEEPGKKKKKKNVRFVKRLKLNLITRI